MTAHSTTDRHVECGIDTVLNHSHLHVDLLIVPWRGARQKCRTLLELRSLLMADTFKTAQSNIRLVSESEIWRICSRYFDSHGSQGRDKQALLTIVSQRFSTRSLQQREEQCPTVRSHTCDDHFSHDTAGHSIGGISSYSLGANTCDTYVLCLSSFLSSNRSL